MIFFGILSIIVGALIIFWIIKNPEDKTYSIGVPETFGAWLSGIMFIIMGIVTRSRGRVVRANESQSPTMCKNWVGLCSLKRAYRASALRNKKKAEWKV